MLLVAREDGIIQVWDTDLNHIIHAANLNQDLDVVLLLQEHETFTRLNDLAWNPVQETFATADDDNQVIIWDANTITQIKILNHDDQVNALDWHLEGNLLAAGDDDGQVLIWDTVSGETIKTFEGHQYVVEFLDWSPDGNAIASAARDDTLAIWDITELNQ